MNRTAKLICTVSILALTITPSLLLAGPLSPPLGPVTPTSKPLSEIEPRTAINDTNTPGDADSLFKITQPGSYYLTANITGVANKVGIEIASSGVTIDLNGFELLGVAGMGNFDAIRSTLIGGTNLHIRNGSIRNWGGDGIDLRTINSTNSNILNLNAAGNAGAGIAVGTNSTLINCSASLNGGFGIVTNSQATITNCVATENTLTGINASFSAAIANCVASVNGDRGFFADNGSTLINCSASNNTSSGFALFNGCTITASAARRNTGIGINASFSCIVANCSVYDNDNIGISVSNGSSVIDCTVGRSALDGIFCTSGCVIRGNTCNQNGLAAATGAGIHATGSDNRIEANNCTGADRGIDVDASGNLIIRNSAASNSVANWDIAANNVVGPIVDRSAPASAAINGNTAASSLGTTDPNANFTY